MGEDRRRARLTDGAGRRLRAHERDDLVAAVAQRLQERAAEQARAAGEERARQGAWIGGCAVSRGGTAASGVSTGAGGAASGSARSADAKLAM